jgi:hypothetical protein
MATSKERADEIEAKLSAKTDEELLLEYGQVTADATDFANLILTKVFEVRSAGLSLGRCTLGIAIALRAICERAQIDLPSVVDIASKLPLVTEDRPTLSTFSGEAPKA